MMCGSRRASLFYIEVRGQFDSQHCTPAVTCCAVYTPIYTTSRSEQFKVPVHHHGPHHISSSRQQPLGCPHATRDRCCLLHHHHHHPATSFISAGGIYIYMRPMAPSLPCIAVSHRCWSSSSSAQGIICTLTALYEYCMLVDFAFLRRLI